MLVVQEPVTYFSDAAPIEAPFHCGAPKLRRYVFTKEDDLYIPAGERRSLYTCSMQSYMYIRWHLQKVYNQFVTLLNRGRWQAKDLHVNRNNQNFRALLQSDDPDDQLFVIPTFSTKSGDFLPASGSGIRFVTAKFDTYGGSLNKGYLLLTVGDSRRNLPLRLIDACTQMDAVGNVRDVYDDVEVEIATESNMAML